MDDAGRRKQRRRELVRTCVEAGAATVLLVVVVAAVAVVLNVAQGRSAAPPNTLVISQTADFQSLDPALATSREAWELEYATCAKLLDYPPRSGGAGTRLEPQVAVALPDVSRDRLTYSFRVQEGWRFSNGELVTPHAFARALVRARSPKLVSPAEPYLREVASWSVDGDTLAIRLSRPAPDLPKRLALPYFCAVPPSTPDEVTDAPPAAGPFYVQRHVDNRSIVLARNPYYGGPRKPHVEKIVYQFGAFAPQIGLQLDRGEADYGVVPASVFESFAGRVGSENHLFTVPQPIVGYLALNTQRPLFRDNPQLRRAINFALDRPALARAFGIRGARPTDQYLPPGFPGYRDADLYPLRGPELETARRIARGHLRGGKAVYLACPGADCRARAVIVEQNLAKIGLHVEIRAGYGQYALAGVRGTGFDIADVVTRPDYGDPYGIVEKLLDGRVIRTVGNTNLSYYADPAFSRALDAAQRLSGAARIRAYELLDVDVARRSAPLAAYANVNARVFLSRRVGCVTYQPVFGLDIAGLCLNRER
ncbi:MAG TPA: ABC transporter substrate-binding protein [Gaiellaceae bacterium]|nr:ABC transporter substrate-binding protein [Gaiellaceae bacterium]